MGVIFSTDHNCLILHGMTKEGVRRQTRFWAERGLIHCEDSLKNDYTVMAVRSFLHRIRAHGDMLKRTPGQRDKGFDASFRLDVQRMIDKALIVAGIAQIQGMPEDASARRDLASRRPKAFAVTENAKYVM